MPYRYFVIVHEIYILIASCKFWDPISSETAASMMLWLCMPKLVGRGGGGAEVLRQLGLK